ncbi:hypothetical protein Godav_015125 [Gossypium davidsonii]|uniref:RNase H type-1 domain-containing protein n=1 Tax=Gossypium davidsonii TaxID=34287 RepID=A0A7J8RM36_GOSDV|nr:hypothetical protein [Gossypium davidsonii]
MKVSSSWSKQFLMSGKSPSSTVQDLILCSNSSKSWVYLNKNGSVRLDDGSVVGGGVVRYRNGEWIIGFNWFLGSCSCSKLNCGAYWMD